MNQILTQEFAETIAAQIKRETPLLEYVNKELSDRLEGGSGATISVLIPNYGLVSKGASFLSQSNNNVQTLGSIQALKVQVDKVPVDISIIKVGASYDLLEKTLKLFTKNSQVNEPRLSLLAKTIHQMVFQDLFIGAATAVVGNIDSVALAEAVAYVDEGRVGERNAGMLSPLLNNSIAASPQFKWYDSALSREHYKGLLGSFMDAEFFKSADAKVGGTFDPDTGNFLGGVSSMQLGTTAATAWSIQGTIAPIADGDTTLTLTNITFGGGNNLTVIPVGTPIVVGVGDPSIPGSLTSAYTMSSVYGEDTLINRVFVVTKDTPITSGAATVPIAPVYLGTKDASGQVTALSTAAVPNTWVTGTPTTTFVCPLLAGTKYALGCVFASNGLAFASAAPRAFAGGVESQTTQLGQDYNAVNVRVSIGADLREGQDIFRAECMVGAQSVYSAGIVNLYGLI